MLASMKGLSIAEKPTKWLRKDCFLVAEASITAGEYNGTNCIVNLAGKDVYTAQCTMQTSRDAVEADWLLGSRHFFP